MSEDAYAPQSPPRCIIVGGGIAGIFLGILLDRAGIPYDIFERAPSVKQLGMISIHSLSYMLISFCRTMRVHNSTPHTMQQKVDPFVLTFAAIAIFLVLVLSSLICS